MKLDFIDPLTQGEFQIFMNEASLGRLVYPDNRKDTLLTIAWNNGPKQRAVIDEMRYEFPEQSILPLMVSQSFRFEIPDQGIAGRSNRDSFALVDNEHDA